MKKRGFEQLLASLKEAHQISKGRRKPARVTTIIVPDTKAIRRSPRLSP